jgi:DivIVA domain-containing protein
VPDRSDVPDFTVSLRGYDRQQVDEYVHRLTLDLDEAHARALGAEQRLAERPTSRSGSFADLGPHVAGVLERAAHEAEQIRSDAEAYAEHVRQEAHLRTAHAQGLSDVRAAAQRLLAASEPVALDLRTPSEVRS